MATHVLVFGKLHRLEDKEVFEKTFADVSRKVLSTTAGILRDELVQDTNDPYAYMLHSEWEDKDAWTNWQSSPIHEEQVGGLQNYWKGQGVRIFSTVYCVERAQLSRVS